MKVMTKNKLAPFGLENKESTTKAKQSVPTAKRS